MTTNNHTPIAVEAAANAATFNAPLSELDTVIGVMYMLGTTAKSNLVAALNEVLNDLGYIPDLTTTSKVDAVHAINELVTRIGNGGDLDTTDKTNLVAAINEVLALVQVQGGGAAATAAVLKAWAEGGAYELTSITYDTTYPEVIASATVKWPDTATGTFTATTINGTWLAVDAYTVSHSLSGLTVTQAAVTRNSRGQITAKPQLTVA